MTLHTKLSAMAAALLLLAAGAAHAAAADGSVKPVNYLFPNGDPGFTLTGHGGPINPGVLVGFNPQPEPPGDVAAPTIDLSNPFAPVITHLAESQGWQFQLAITGFGDGSVIPLPTFSREGFHTTRALLGDHVFLIGLLFGPGAVDPGSLVGFNPQPDPPGDVLAGQFNFEGAADPFMAFTMEIDGHPISFSYGVPEPSEWA
ncbi:MAG: hypothetical protein JWQ29_2519, partial [Phenylobacterium sp.]|nr:hypothetical protein [Phenylobacterium sp.]